MAKLGKFGEMAVKGGKLVAETIGNLIPQKLSEEERERVQQEEEREFEMSLGITSEDTFKTKTNAINKALKANKSELNLDGVQMPISEILEKLKAKSPAEFKKWNKSQQIKEILKTSEKNKDELVRTAGESNQEIVEEVIETKAEDAKEVASQTAEQAVKAESEKNTTRENRELTQILELLQSSNYGKIAQREGRETVTDKQRVERRMQQNPQDIAAIKAIAQKKNIELVYPESGVKTIAAVENQSEPEALSDSKEVEVYRGNKGWEIKLYDPTKATEHPEVVKAVNKEIEQGEAPQKAAEEIILQIDAEKAEQIRELERSLEGDDVMIVDSNTEAVHNAAVQAEILRGKNMTQLTQDMKASKWYQFKFLASKVKSIVGTAFDRVGIIKQREQAEAIIREHGHIAMEIDTTKGVLKSVAEQTALQGEIAKSHASALLALRAKHNEIEYAEDETKDTVTEADAEKSKQILAVFPDLIKTLYLARKNGTNADQALSQTQKSLQQSLREILGESLLYRGNMLPMLDHIAQLAVVSGIKENELSIFVADKLGSKKVNVAQLASTRNTKVIGGAEEKIAQMSQSFAKGGLGRALGFSKSGISLAAGVLLAIGISKPAGLILGAVGGSALTAAIKTAQQERQSRLNIAAFANAGREVDLEAKASKRYNGVIMETKEGSAIGISEFQKNVSDYTTQIAAATGAEKAKLQQDAAQFYYQMQARITASQKYKLDLVLEEGMDNAHKRLELLKGQVALKNAIGSVILEQNTALYDESMDYFEEARNETVRQIRKINLTQIASKTAQAALFAGVFSLGATAFKATAMHFELGDKAQELWNNIQNRLSGQASVSHGNITEAFVSGQSSDISAQTLESLQHTTSSFRTITGTHTEMQAWGDTQVTTKLSELSGYKHIDPNVSMLHTNGTVKFDGKELQLNINNSGNSTQIDVSKIVNSQSAANFDGSHDVNFDQVQPRLKNHTYIFLNFDGHTNKDVLAIPVGPDGIVKLDGPLHDILSKGNFHAVSTAVKMPDGTFHILNTAVGKGYDGSFGVEVTKTVQIPNPIPNPNLNPSAPPIPDQIPDAIPPTGTAIPEQLPLTPNTQQQQNFFDSLKNSQIGIPAYVHQDYASVVEQGTKTGMLTPNEKLQALRNNAPIPAVITLQPGEKTPEQIQQAEQSVQKVQGLIALRNEKLNESFSPQQLDDLTPTQTEKLNAYLDNILANPDANYAEKVEKLKEKLDETTSRLLGLLDTSTEKSLAKTSIDRLLTQQFLLSAIDPDSDPKSDAVQSAFALILTKVLMQQRQAVAVMQPRTSTEKSIPAQINTDERLADIIANAKKKSEATNISSWQVRMEDVLKNIAHENSDEIIFGGSVPVGLVALRDQAKAKIGEVETKSTNSELEPQPELPKEEVNKLENDEPKLQKEPEKTTDSEQKEVKKFTGLPLSIYQKADSGDKKSQNIIAMYNILQENPEYATKLEKIVSREVTTLEQFSKQNFNENFVSSTVKWYSEQVRLAYLTEIYAVYERNKDPKVAGEVVELLFKNERFGTEESAKSVHNYQANATSTIIVDTAKKSFTMQKYVFEAISEYTDEKAQNSKPQDLEKALEWQKIIESLKADFVTGVDTYRQSLLEAVKTKIETGISEKISESVEESNKEQIPVEPAVKVSSKSANIELAISLSLVDASERVESTSGDDRAFQNDTTLAIADGMGGYKNGDKAADAAIASLQKNLNKLNVSPTEATQAMLDLLKLTANDIKLESLKYIDKKERPHTVLALAHILENDGLKQLITGSVGDSLIFKLDAQSGELMQLNQKNPPFVKIGIALGEYTSDSKLNPSEKTKLYTLAIEYLANGDGTKTIEENMVIATSDAELAKRYVPYILAILKMRNRAETVEDVLDSSKNAAEIALTPIQSGDKVIIVSDGVSDNLTQNQIKEIFEQNSQLSDQEIAELIRVKTVEVMFTTGNTRSKVDDISIVIKTIL